MSDAFTGPYWDAFFTLHRDMPREGPGAPEDVAWAADLAGIPADARICDVACGPGADIPALRAAAPEGEITALDKVAQFVETARERHGHLPRTRIDRGDMAVLEGLYDFIWCAGAIYFLGVSDALRKWRPALAPGGAVALSQVCWLSDTPSEAARAGWKSYADMTNAAGVLAAIEAAGYTCLGTRVLGDAAWEAYYDPLDARAAALASEADADLTKVIDESRAESALWRSEKQHFGYLLCVARPA